MASDWRHRRYQQARTSDSGPQLPERYKGHWGEGLTAKEMKNCVWLKSRLVAQVDFLEWTALGHLRASKFVCLRSDKPAQAVVRE